MKGQIFFLAALLFVSVSGEQFDKRSCQSCQRVSSSIGEIYQNLTANDQLEYLLTKLCTSDYEGSNEFVCKHISKAISPLFQRIGSDDFCTSIKACPATSSQIAFTKFTRENSTCPFCVDLVQQGKIAISDPKTVDQMKKIGDKFCLSLPSLNKECSTLLRDELANFLYTIDHTNALTTCTALHLCAKEEAGKSNAIPKQPLVAEKTSVILAADTTPSTAFQSLQFASSSLKCVICDDVLGFAFKVLAQNRTEEAIGHALSSVCSLFYRHNNVKMTNCDSVIENYTEQFIKLLINAVHPQQVCALLRLCGSPVALKVSMVNEPNKLPIEVSSQRLMVLPQTQVGFTKLPTCLICTKVFKYVYARLNISKADEDIEKLLDESCDVLFRHWTRRPETFARCEYFVGNNTEAIVKFIKSDAGSELTCMALGMCTPFGQRVKVEMLEAKPKSQIITPKKPSSPECYLCKRIVSEIYKDILTNKSEANVEANLDRVCKKLFANPKICENYVKQYAPILIKFITTYDTPEKVCKALHDCPASSLAQLTFLKPIPIYSHVNPSPLQESAACDVCKVAFGIVYKDLKENATQASLEQAAEKICKYVSLQNCKQIVDEYVKQIIDAVENSTNPAEACSYLGYCPTNLIQSTYPISLPKIEAPAKEAVNSELCDQCLKFVQPIHDFVGNPSCEKKVMEDITKLCNQCPSKDKCISTLQTNAKMIFDDLNKYTKPRYVCSTLGVCEAMNLKSVMSISKARRSGLLSAIQEAKNSIDIQGPTTNDKINEIVSPDQFGNNTFCYECQMAMHFMQQVLFSPAVEDSIIEKLKENVCASIASSLEKKVCNDYFDHYGRQMIQHFAINAFNQTRVCVDQIRVCQN